MARRSLALLLWTLVGAARAHAPAATLRPRVPARLVSRARPPLAPPARMLLADGAASGWLDAAASLTPAEAEQLAGPFFGGSLFPYLAFLYFLNARESAAPRGVVVGFAWCLVFVFLTIPAAICAKLAFGVSLADCDWLHGSAESLLTVTNLVLVLALRDALARVEQPAPDGAGQTDRDWIGLGVALSALSAASGLAPALEGAGVHAPFLGGLLNLPAATPLLAPLLAVEPQNALSVACWLIHGTSLVEWLVAMGLVWRWAEAVERPAYKGLTIAMIPLHSSGITACVFHLFYNSPAVCALLPTQAALTCVGNACCAFAAYRIAKEGGWSWEQALASAGARSEPLDGADAAGGGRAPAGVERRAAQGGRAALSRAERAPALEGVAPASAPGQLVFVFKLFAGCAAGVYAVKYGELAAVDFFTEGAALGAALACIGVPTLLNVGKWASRSREDNAAEGGFGI